MLNKLHLRYAAVATESVTSVPLVFEIRSLSLVSAFNKCTHGPDAMDLFLITGEEERR